ncbi:MAG: N-formylglutamate amidohydrolase [Wenzhouxiangella sp.]|nr:MAG: N-formylglutamate amidohydrolase [Wenzhouxiangella sp.]
MPGRKPAVSGLITAEHASRRVPKAYRQLFAGAESVLKSHRAWDPGTRQLARELSESLDLPLLEGKVTRLLVDLNRSVGHPRHISEFSRNLPADQRKVLIERYWQPHWDAYRHAIEQAPGLLVHIACHSFSPEMDGVRRQADIGLLYDPGRPSEQHFCRQLAKALSEDLPGLRVRMNYPYRGNSNGMGQQHRRLFPAHRLLTVELEVNSALVNSAAWQSVRRVLAVSIGRVLGATVPVGC